MTEEKPLGKYYCAVVGKPDGWEAVFPLDIMPSVNGCPPGKYNGLPHILVHADDFKHPGELVDAINGKLNDHTLNLSEIAELLGKDKKLKVDPRVRSLSL